MRCYSFTNFYLSSIQHPIQAGHARDAMWLQAMKTGAPEKYNLLKEWAADHKTQICLNGGDCDSLGELYLFLNDSRNEYPFDFFRESHGALNSALTAITVILPEKIYEAKAALMPSIRRERCAKTIESAYIELKTRYEKFPYSKEAWCQFERDFGKLSHWDCMLIDELSKYGMAK